MRHRYNNPVTPSAVIPAKAGIQQDIDPRSGQNLVVRLRRFFSTSWIPAFAGMTALAIMTVID
ncbi:MAG: hypothetical protein LBE50_02580 [Gallionellaceae bacterium]|jgi:hypothetical protein|nr:hypothetical protein [Gallionellaceae bacterium]